ncbi:hypothetical protein L1987_34829 [Smallanthus sonchifolius]|uniref:Uncharacterized protein n=1 Tax=Smallanthus sonchifolius TaxID=185202 RepID=A0ACB9HUX2_9ASTR|nr:hypothetical protein L1987_34829 [Smallanthus sonchifolius]
MEDDIHNYRIGSGFAALRFVPFVSGSQHPSSGSFRLFLDLNIRLFLDLRKFRLFLDLCKKQVRSPQVPLKEKEIIEYLEVKLSNQILHLWELSLALTVASLPPCVSTAPEVRENANNGCFLSLL